MTGERRTLSQFREESKTNFQRSVTTLAAIGAAELPFSQALLNRHGKIDWNRRRQDANISGIRGSTAASIHYAYIQTGRGKNFIQLFGEERVEVLEEAIDRVLDDPEMSKIFYENLGRPLTTVSPIRRVPLQYILLSEFGNVAIRGIDLGAGAHIGLPFLDSDKYLDLDPNTEYKKKREELTNVLGNPSVLNITLGLGVDIQDGRNDPDWLRAGTWPIAAYKPIIENLDNLLSDATHTSERFPSLSADIRDAHVMDKIYDITGKNGQTPYVDFVVSSFVRHQLGQDATTQQKFIDLVNRLLREDGIWIDIGEEFFSGEDVMRNKVRVYQKHDGELKLVGTPFELKDQKYIDYVDLEYFGKSLGN